MTSGSLILEQKYEDRLMEEGGLLLSEPAKLQLDRLHQASVAARSRS